MNENFDAQCFKCVEEMQKSNQGGAAANILAMKMQKGIASQDLDNIHLCQKHA